MGVGEGDLVFGLPWLEQAAKKWELPILSANLDCDQKNPFPGWRVVERGGLKVGVVALTGNSVKAEGCVATEPVAALRAALTEMEAMDGAGSLDLHVLLSSLSPEDTKKALNALSGEGPTTGDPAAAASPLWIDFVIMGQGRREFSTPDTLAGGGLLLGAGSRSKKLGVLEFDAAAAGHRWRDTAALGDLAARKDSLNNQIKETKGRIAEPAPAPGDPASAERLKERQRLESRLSYYERELAKVDAQLSALTSADAARPATHRFQELSADIADHPATAERVAAAKADVDALAGATSAAYTGPFIGNARCAACHPAETLQWATTPHAGAYASLQADDRARDPACYTCHVTGALHPDGPKHPGAVSGLENVGCESCHGPGRDHAQTPAQVDMIRTPPVSTCTGCHDGQKDEGRFEEAAYWARVVHAPPGK